MGRDQIALRPPENALEARGWRKRRVEWTRRFPSGSRQVVWCVGALAERGSPSRARRLPPPARSLLPTGRALKTRPLPPSREPPHTASLHPIRSTSRAAPPTPARAPPEVGDPEFRARRRRKGGALHSGQVAEQRGEERALAPPPRASRAPDGRARPRGRGRGASGALALAWGAAAALARGRPAAMRMGRRLWVERAPSWRAGQKTR